MRDPLLTRTCLLMIVLGFTLGCNRNHEGICGQEPQTESDSILTATTWFPYLSEYVNWDSLELNVPLSERELFMDTVHWYNAMYGSTGNPELIHLINLNSDDTPYYVYYGPGPGFDTKEMITVLRINSSSISVLGTLKAWDIDEGILKRLHIETTTDHDGANSKIHTSYEVVDHNGNLSLKKVFESEMNEATVLPSSLNKTCIVKTLCSGSITLYREPGRLPQENGERHAATNVLILTDSVDNMNTTWYFVAIPPMPNQDHLYQMGWLPRLSLQN